MGICGSVLLPEGLDPYRMRGTGQEPGPQKGPRQD